MPETSLQAGITLVFAVGATHSGKTTTLKALAEQLRKESRNVVYIEKDVISQKINVPSNPADPQYNDLNFQAYDIAAKQTEVAISNANPGDVIICDAFVGNKLNLAFIRKLTDHPAVDTKFIYCHCPGDIHQKRIANFKDPRDTDKSGDKYPNYRKKELEEFAKNLAMLGPQGYLFLNTDQLSQLPENVTKSIQHLNIPTVAPYYHPQSVSFSKGVHKHDGPIFELLLAQHATKTRAPLHSKAKKHIILDLTHLVSITLASNPSDLPSIELKPGVKEFIQYWQQQGIQVCGVSYTWQATAQQFKSAVKIENFKIFDSPNDPIGQALRENELDADECLFVSAEKKHQILVANKSIKTKSGTLKFEEILTIEVPKTSTATQEMLEAVTHKIKMGKSLESEKVEQRVASQFTSTLFTTAITEAKENIKISHPTA